MDEAAGVLLYNSVSVFRPDGGEPLVCRKFRLFYKESMVFNPGDRGFPVFRDDRFDVLLRLAFSRVARSRAFDGTELIVCP